MQPFIGWGSEQLGVAEDVPAHCKVLNKTTFKGPFQPKPFYESMIRRKGNKTGLKICRFPPAK